MKIPGVDLMDVRHEVSLGPHMCLVRSKLSSGGAGTRITSFRIH